MSKNVYTRFFTPPILTRYGRLIHDDGTGEPRIESNFAILHYKKAIKEFNDAKRNWADGDVDEAISCGSYCIISLGALIEAVANKIFYVANEIHPDENDGRKAIVRIHEEGNKIRVNSKNSILSNRLEKLKESSDEYAAIEFVRKTRNSLLHYTEDQWEVDPDTRLSRQYEVVSENKCRWALKHVRIGLKCVLDQLPEVQPTVVLSEIVNWMGKNEVP